LSVRRKDGLVAGALDAQQAAEGLLLESAALLVCAAIYPFFSIHPGTSGFFSGTIRGEGGNFVVFS